MVHSPQLRVLRCSACGRLDCGPREVCPTCFNSGFEHTEVDGAGTLVSWTIIRRPPTRFREHGPYCVVVVDLEAGIRMTARLEGDAETARLGDRLILVKQEGEVATFHREEPAFTTGAVGWRT